ncbi:MAG: hypothetical protein HY257_04655 [Chloroflexi bacterium]|nr:hypothetical protein [Chloroflexota bacterium]
MYAAVQEWIKLQTGQKRRRAKGDFDDSDEWSDEPSKRTTKTEFLADKFSGGDMNKIAVSPRKFDYWAKQFNTGKWDIPGKRKKKSRKEK